MQEEVLNELPGADLRVYCVWVSLAPLDTWQAAEGQRGLMKDARVTHYWTETLRFPREYRAILPVNALCVVAWDVYALYPRGEVWHEGTPSRPAFFMHQLGCERTAPLLDGTVLRDSVQAHLARR